jgi:hypothetical protein
MVPFVVIAWADRNRNGMFDCDKAIASLTTVLSIFSRAICTLHIRTHGKLTLKIAPGPDR